MLSKRIPMKSGFTLVELLVVIAIIALLVSLLLPALAKAKYHAQRVFCLSSIRSQAIAQFQYASDNHGTYSPNDGNGPQYMRSPAGGGTRTFDVMYDDYIADVDVMFCPLTDEFNPRRVYTGNGGYGGWDILEWTGVSSYGVAWDPASGDSPAYISGTYCWFANFRRGSNLGGLPPVAFEPGTLPWPANTEESTSDTGFISHELSSPTKFTGIHWDASHGSDISNSLTGNEDFEAEDTPVGYADGSVVYILKNNLRPRANVPWNGNYFYWY